MPLISIQYYNSPCGKLVLASMAGELCLCDWNVNPCAERNLHRLTGSVDASIKTEATSVLEETKKQLDEYFAGRRQTFDIPLRPIGTDFQHRVWSALLRIPYGETRILRKPSGVPKPSEPWQGLLGQTASASSSPAIAS